MPTNTAPTTAPSDTPRDMVSNFIANVRDSLSTMGMTQTALAEKLGMPRRRLNDKLNGRGVIYVDDVGEISDALGIDLAYAFRRNGASAD